MAWIETESISFTARHDEADTGTAQRTLDDLEDLRLRLEDRFEQVPGDVSLIIHTSPAWLSFAHPYLPAARWSAAPAGRRYLAGWPMATELHVLNDTWLERRAAGEDSLTALRGTAERLYAQLTVAANNPDLPPPWTPRRFSLYWRWAWLLEGAGQYFARQVPLYRAAVITRLREGNPPSFPPGRRDAVLLGGTVFDLLEREAGPEACDRLVSRLRKEGPIANLEFAFEARTRTIERAWREHLRELDSRRTEARKAPAPTEEPEPAAPGVEDEEAAELFDESVTESLDEPVAGREPETEAAETAFLERDLVQDPDDQAGEDDRGDDTTEQPQR